MLATNLLTVLSTLLLPSMTLATPAADADATSDIDKRFLSLWIISTFPMICENRIGFPTLAFNGTGGYNCTTWDEEPGCVNVQPMLGHKIWLYDDVNCTGKKVKAEKIPTNYEGGMAKSFEVE